MREIDGHTKICAVIGDPVGHSLSPGMHNAAFEALGLNYAYVAFRVADVRAAMAGAAGFNLRGLSVTIPHKIAVIEHLDALDEPAARIGAVNTVTNDDGVLRGTNTDGYGALRALETAGPVDGKTVAILGVGGAARAIAFTLATNRKPVRIVLAARNAERAGRLAADIEPFASCPVATASFESDGWPGVFQASEIVINCTPTGMSPNVNECLIPEGWFREGQLVFDTIYNPEKTLLLKRAERGGAKTLNGVPMFVHQGARQFQLWTGCEPPLDAMEAAVLRALRVP